MRNLSICLSAVLLFGASSVFAQDEADMQMPGPSPELKKFQPVLGDWKGSGTTQMMPGQPPSKWTSVGSAKWVMNGFCVQEDVRIEFEDANIPVMVWRKFYGWDANKKKIVAFGCTNEGKITKPITVHWIGNSRVELYSHETPNGPMVQRNVMNYTEHGCTFKVQMAMGAGDMMTTVEGSLERTTLPYELTEKEWQSSFGPAPEQMKKLHCIAGLYGMEGSWVAAPGSFPMTFSGDESIRPVFAGSFLEMKAKGHPMEGNGFVYESVAYICWDANKECYAQFFVNNMGQIGESEMRWVDDKRLVAMHAGLEMGTPQASRSMIELDDKGAIQKASMHRIASDASPDKAFWAKYIFKGKGDSKKQLEKVREGL